MINGQIVLGRQPKGSQRPPISCDLNFSTPECIHIALINNMPDAALQDTENQFFALLGAAAGDLSVHVGLYSMPEIVRGEQAQQHISNFYSEFRDLPNHHPDALIITGTEPRQPDLRNEAYWRTLGDLLDWAERETVSVILSCLATHASVLHRDGIERHRLDEKRFGVFDERKACKHPLTTSLSDAIRIPHSRWNDLREEDLASCGYVVLTTSQEGGVGLFVKQMRRSLFVHSQGHPEYSTDTLLKEYRRDIRRFINQESETYPSMPKDYFSRQTTKFLTNFREHVLTDRREDLLALFPCEVIAETLQNGWHAEGVQLYRSWLHLVSSRKSQAKKCMATTAAYGRERQPRSAAR